MKKILKILIPILAIFFIPLFAFAANWPLVQACSDSGCGWNDLMSLVNRVVKFILFDLAVPIAAIMFVYAGVLLVTAGGSEGKTKAKGIFTNAVIGLALAAGAWLIVSTILSILGYQGAWIGF